jgi:hypothetical protein
MAILSLDTLTGCNSIPGFINAGSRMIFEQASAPSSWTKETSLSYNNRALRVVGGANGLALSPGGNVEFPSIFTATKAISPFSVDLGPSNITIQPASGYITIQNSISNFSVGAASPNLRAHTHPYPRKPGVNGAGRPAATARNPPTAAVTVGTDAKGGNGTHQHGLNDSGHIHPASTGIHDHQSTITQHNHLFTMTSRDFNILYVDTIVCQKN